MVSQVDLCRKEGRRFHIGVLFPELGPLHDKSFSVMANWKWAFFGISFLSDLSIWSECFSEISLIGSDV